MRNLCYMRFVLPLCPSCGPFPWGIAFQYHSHFHVAISILRIRRFLSLIHLHKVYFIRQKKQDRSICVIEISTACKIFTHWKTPLQIVRSEDLNFCPTTTIVIINMPFIFSGFHLPQQKTFKVISILISLQKYLNKNFAWTWCDGLTGWSSLPAITRIPYASQFMFRLLHFLSRSLLMALESCWGWLKSLVLWIHVGDMQEPPGLRSAQL